MLLSQIIDKISRYYLILLTDFEKANQSGKMEVIEMKAYFKVFIIAFICCTLLFTGGALAFMMFWGNGNDEPTVPSEEAKNENNEEHTMPNNPVEDKESELEKLIKNSNRVNILVLGFEGPRTDTIILASFDPDKKLVDLISVPRDTYYFEDKYKGTKYDTLGHRKINAAYIRGGVEETMKDVSEIMCNIPIDAHVGVTYRGVENIVDSLGGVEVNIPINMNYDDPLAKPELHIHLNKGVTKLNGKKAIQFLRFRKNNNGTGYPDGDLGRIKAQQQFLKNAASKTLSLRLPLVAHTAFKFVKTNLDLKKIALLANEAKDLKMDNLKAYMLPGEAFYDRVSYYRYDPKAVEKMLIEIYKRSNEE